MFRKANPWQEKTSKITYSKFPHSKKKQPNNKGFSHLSTYGTIPEYIKKVYSGAVQAVILAQSTFWLFEACTPYYYVKTLKPLPSLLFGYFNLVFMLSEIRQIENFKKVINRLRRARGSSMIIKITIEKLLKMLPNKGCVVYVILLMYLVNDRNE